MKMKRNLFSLVSLLVFTHSSLTAQQKIDEGKVVYEITYPDMELDPQMAAMMPTESVVYFKGNMSRSEITMGMGISSTTIVNSKTNEVTSLNDMMGNKTATIIDTDDQKKEKDDDYKVELVNETKEISGYKCKKAILKNTSGSLIELFYTENISASSQFSSQWKSLKGFPLEYVIDVSGMNMKMTAKSITSEKVSDELFKIPPDYKLMSQEEFKKLLGGE